MTTNTHEITPDNEEFGHLTDLAMQLLQFDLLIGRITAGMPQHDFWADDPIKSFRLLIDWGQKSLFAKLPEEDRTQLLGITSASNRLLGENEAEKREFPTSKYWPKTLLGYQKVTKTPVPDPDYDNQEAVHKLIALMYKSPLPAVAADAMKKIVNHHLGVQTIAHFVMSKKPVKELSVVLPVRLDALTKDRDTTDQIMKAVANAWAAPGQRNDEHPYWGNIPTLRDLDVDPEDVVPYREAVGGWMTPYDTQQNQRERSDHQPIGTNRLGIDFD